MKLILLLLAASCAWGQAKFPTTVATPTDLLVAKRISQSTLTSSLSSSTLTVPVVDGTQFVANELIRIDNEEMVICSISVNTLTLCTGSRGWDGTTAATHANGAAVRGVITATHHNQAVLEIAAIEGRLRELNAYCRSTTGNDTYTCSTTPPLAAYVTGRCLVLNPDTANTTGATIQVTSLTQVSILTRAGATLATGDITANQPITICYNGTAFVVQGDGGAGGGGTGDASTNTSSSVDGEAVLFSGTGGKTLRRSTLTGVIRQTSGVESVVPGAGSDYVKVDGTSGPGGSGGSGTSVVCVAASGSTTAYTCSGTITSYTQGMAVSFFPDLTNTGPSTLNINSVGAVNIYKMGPSGTSVLSTSDLLSGSTYDLIYDGTEFVAVSIPNLGIQNEGTPLTPRKFVNYTGDSVNCIDNAGSLRTDCTFYPAVSHLTDFQVIKASGTQLFGNVSCSATYPCNVRYGNTTYTFTSSFSATITAGTGTAYIYISNAGAIVVASTALTISPCTGCTFVSAAVFPSDSIPLYTWTATSSTVWDATGVDLRSAFSRTRFIAGANITLTDVGNATEIASTGGGSATGFKLESAQSGDITVAATATETDLHSYTLAANELGNGQQLFTKGRGRWAPTNSTLTLRAYMGATVVWSAVIGFWSGTPTGGASWEFDCEARSALGASATVSCQGMASFGTGTTPGTGGSNSTANASTFSIATNGTLTIKFTAQWSGASTDSITATSFRSIRYN